MFDRLTENEKVFKEKGLEIDKIYANKQYIKEIYKKLSQLEDIEKELGIDLITLFKALKNGIYVKINRLIKQARIMNADIKHKTLTYITVEDWNEDWLNFIGYGKTWALAKEELL